MEVRKITLRVVGAFLLSFATLPMLAGGSTTYYATAKAGISPTGAGLVYANIDNKAPSSDEDYKTESTSSQWSHEKSGFKDMVSSHSVGLFAKPNENYILKNWTMGSTNEVVGLDNHCLAPLQGTKSSSNVVTYTANFVSSDTQLGKFYRFKNVSTGKYASLVNDKLIGVDGYTYLIGTVGGGLSQASGNIDKIYAALGKEYMSVDMNMVDDQDLTQIGDIFFVRDKDGSGKDFAIGTEYDIAGQGTTLNQIASGDYPGNMYITFYGNYVKFSKQGDNYYITLKPHCDNSTGNGMFTDCYFYDNSGTFSIDQNKPDASNTAYQWTIEPVEYFCVKPLNENIKDSQGNYWTTLTTAFPYTIPEDGGVLGAYTVSKTKTEDGKTYAELSTLTEQGGTVPAETPVLLKLSKDKDAADYKLVPTGNHVVGNSSKKVTKNLLSGVYLDSKEANNQTNYRVLNVSSKTGKIGFFKMSSDVKYMAGNKAFLDLTQTKGAKGAVYIDFDNIDSDVTGITNIHHDEEEPENPVYYDLQGRRVEHPQHGIYIVNGKKVFIK